MKYKGGDKPKDRKLFYNGKMKSCSNCLEIKDLKDFPKSGAGKEGCSSFWRGDCKRCHSLKTYNRVIEKAADKRPNQFWCCSLCDNINARSRVFCRSCKKGVRK